MWDHHQRHAARAGMGGVRDSRNLEYDSVAREDLRERRHRTGSLLQGRRRAARFIQRQERQIPRADWRYPPETLEAYKKRAELVRAPFFFLEAAARLLPTTSTRAARGYSIRPMSYWTFTFTLFCVVP